MTEDAKRKQRKRRQICLKFTDNPADWLIYQHIKKQQNIAAYIRRLVQRDMTDAEPVRHGHWEFDGELNTGIYALCSVCGESIYQCGTWNYCPNCGAKMDEEVMSDG